MAAADQSVLLGHLREAQTALTQRLEAALASRPLLTAVDVGDGIDEWRQLYAALGPTFQGQLAQDSGAEGEGGHTDEMLRRWIARCLIPPRCQELEVVVPYKIPSIQDVIGPLLDGGRSGTLKLPAGTILRGSATAWLLGKPAERPVLDENFGHGVPGQYLHKAALLMLRDFAEGGSEPQLLVLLNGPEVGSTSSGPVFFGGPHAVERSGSVYEVKGPVPYRFQGVIVLLPGVLEELLQLRAVEVAEGLVLQEVLSAEPQLRWEAAGGRIETLREAASAALGDVQKRKWYKRFYGLDVFSGE